MCAGCMDAPRARSLPIYISRKVPPMHGDTILLMTFVLALVAAFAGGLVARALRLPPLVGYLLGGLAVGPFTPGFIGDSQAMNQLSEVGVMFMMFGTGLHFSLKDLAQVKGVAVPGAIIQIVLGTLAGYGLAQAFGWSAQAGIMLGLSVSIASTVVLIKNLTDEGLYQTRGGRIATGWLIVEDLATVLILVVLPVVFGPGEVEPAQLAGQIGVALTKTAAFVLLMLVVGSKALPWLLDHIERSCPRELFQLAVVVVALGTAMLASVAFDLSVALGAFLAGVVVSGDKLSHRIAAEAIPFQDLFSIIFFASVGMMVNPAILAAHLPELLALVALIMVGKWLINMVLGMAFSVGVETSLTIASGLSQIGEFSFIIGQTGMALGILSADQYSLILGGAVVSIALNTFVFKLAGPAAHAIHSRPGLARFYERHAKAPEPVACDMCGHVVVVGYGSAGESVVDALTRLDVSCLVVERDLETAEAAQAAGAHILVGDAANSEVLRHAHLDQARVLAIAMSHEHSAEKIASEARAANPDIKIVTRADTAAGVAALVEAGADEVVRPELEGGIELLRHTLIDLGYRPKQISGCVERLRESGYEALGETSRTKRIQAFERMVSTMSDIDIQWASVGEGAAGKSPAQLDVRGRTGAQAVALRRAGSVQPFVNPAAPLQVGDVLGLMGTVEQTEAAEHLLA